MSPRIRSLPSLFLGFLVVVCIQSGRNNNNSNNNNGLIYGYTTGSLLPIRRIGTSPSNLRTSICLATNPNYNNNNNNNDDVTSNKNKQEMKLPDRSSYSDIPNTNENSIFWDSNRKRRRVDNTSVAGGGIIRQQQQQQQRRRAFVQSSLVTLVTSSVAWMNDNNNNMIANAAITDETDTFASNWWTTPSSSSSPNDNKSNPPLQQKQQSERETSDEISVVLSKDELKKQKGLGIELSDIEFRTNLRVYVKSIQPGSYGEQLGIQKDWIIIGVNNQSVERTNAAGVAQYIQIALQQQKGESSDNTILLKFRDPFIFQTKLRNLNENDVVTTQVAPAGETTQYYPDGTIRPGAATYRDQTEQKITVSQLVPPKLCTKGGASVDDLLEISYIGRVVETGQLFDGSAIKINNQGIAGRGDDVTLYFVLGKQPFGQFPPGWDVGLIGICIGERRRITIPPALAYGNIGIPRRNIPPNATLQYDVTLVSLNGLSTIQ